MKVESIAAIDVGSNAVRLLVNNVEDYEERKALKKNAYIRVPVRLGEDVFKTGLIGEKKVGRLVETMLAFRHLMNVYNVRNYRACATSAMREASNETEIRGLVYMATGLQIDIISGDQEADLVFSAGALEEIMPGDSTYLHVDVGGGSTEVVVYCDHKKELSLSFPIGTLRLLNGAVPPSVEEDFENSLQRLKEDFAPQAIIASGGNINKTLKLLGRQDGDSIGFADLNTFYQALSALTFEERLEQYKMNSYRADVIVPAMHIFLTIGRFCQIERYIIPKVGLVDGIIRQLYSGELEPRLVDPSYPAKPLS